MSAPLHLRAHRNPSDPDFPPPEPVTPPPEPIIPQREPDIPSPEPDVPPPEPLETDAGDRSMERLARRSVNAGSCAANSGCLQQQ